MRISHHLLTTAILLTPWTATSEELNLTYPRLRQAAPIREVAPAPLPDALELRGGVRRPPRDDDAVDIDRQARRAVAATVDHAIRDATRGRFDVGFWQGMRRAFDDSYLGHDARSAGFSDGHYAPDATELGHRLGHDAALARAEDLAHTEIEAQFRDLSREPRADAGRPSVFPTLDLPPVAAPNLRAVFHEMPYRGSHSINPWKVYRCTSFRELYRGRWGDPERGFRHWEKKQRHGAYWHQLNADEKGRFRVVFLYEYATAMADHRPRLRRAHRRGFDEGWHHGARLHGEWSYRQGYHEGYELALNEASDRGFHDTFEPHYEALYRRLFDEWSTQPRPEILGVWLADANDDGVFEPGEEVLASYEIANYGGAGANLPLRIGSDVATSGEGARIELPRRRVTRSRHPLRWRIAANAPARTKTTAFFELAGETHEVPLRVAYPLELEAPVRLIGHDAISGRASLAVSVVNRSRRPVPAAITLVAGGRTIDARELAGPLAAGADREIRFEARGLEPLELLAGDARFVVEARSDSKLHDQLTYRAPSLATRLQDPALENYLVALARGGGSPAEVAQAHQLMLERLRADWRRAVEVGGNPYRTDRKRASAETALGGLVRTFKTHRVSLDDPRVFTELVPKIETLAGDLPGAHPFLRSQMKRLARQLG